MNDGDDGEVGLDGLARAIGKTRVDITLGKLTADARFRQAKSLLAKKPWRASALAASAVAIRGACAFNEGVLAVADRIYQRAKEKRR